MSDTTPMVQVLLRRDGGETVVWLPQRFSKIGTVVDLKDKRLPGGWDEGWRVVVAYSGSVLATDTVRERATDYKHTREASDV